MKIVVFLFFMSFSQALFGEDLSLVQTSENNIESSKYCLLAEEFLHELENSKLSEIPKFKNQKMTSKRSILNKITNILLLEGFLFTTVISVCLLSFGDSIVLIL